MLKLLISGFIGLLVLASPGRAAPTGDIDHPLQLVTETDSAGHRISEGTYTVYENRATRSGRTIDLEIVILHATGDDPLPDPIFSMAGGPGQNAAAIARWGSESHLRKKRDIVSISQRGTGGSNPLRCAMSGSPEHVQGYLDGAWDPDVYRECLKELSARADLKQYSTPIAMDDIDEIRQALGYERINLMGGSYGTRASLVYMRRHPETVRTAILSGVAPIAFTNPLYHAAEAQRALDRIIEECAADPDCHERYGDLDEKFLHVLERLEAQPVEVSVKLPFMDEAQTVTLTRQAFAGAFRALMYYDSRSIPSRIETAFQGDFKTFAEAGITRNKGIQDQLAFGMLMCVTCAEDVDRIDDAVIDELTKDTFFGGDRVRAQKALCDFWPRSELPENYGDDVSVDVPTLLLSGAYDPVTGPRWGQQAADHLPHSLHVVAPGSHGVGGACIQDIIDAFLEAGSVEGIDVSCVQEMDLGSFR